MQVPPSRVYTTLYPPGYTSPVHPLLHCPTRRCRQSPLTALRRGVTELIVSDEGVTVAGVTVPVSLLVKSSPSAQSLPVSPMVRVMLRRVVLPLHTRFTVGGDRSYVTGIILLVQKEEIRRVYQEGTFMLVFTRFTGRR